MQQALTIDSEFDHERLILLSDRRTGLRGAIALHSTALGPAVGGLRWRPYPSITAAAVDALRLSRAMTLKNSAAGLNWGGGKACVVADGEGARREQQMLAFADAVNGLEGAFIMGKDVGMTIPGMDLISSRTRWIVGISPERGGLGDPSPATARTVLGSMAVAAELLWGPSDLAGRSVAVIGTGGVGARLAEYAAERGASVSVADIDEERARDAAARTGGTVTSVAEAIHADVDFLAPCATGEMIGTDDVAHLRCRVIAGGANNPLVDDTVADLLHERGTLYVPDFLSNSGGVIQNAVEFRSGSMAEVDELVEAAVARTRALLERAARDGRAPYAVAREEALRRVEQAV